MPAHEPSNPELADRLDRLEKNVIGHLDDLKAQMGRMEDKVVWRDTYQADMRATTQRFGNVEDDVEEIRRSQTWIRRAILANLILPVIVIVIGAILVANLVPAGAS